MKSLLFFSFVLGCTLGKLQFQSLWKKKLLVVKHVHFQKIATSYGRSVLPRYSLGNLNGAKHLTLPEGKIVGGSEVVPNSLPFQVSVQREAIINFVHTCGGTVLTETTILTSANCVEGYRKKP